MGLTPGRCYRSGVKTAPALLAAAALALAACGSSTPAVQGSVTDTLITAKSLCGGHGNTLQVALTSASGRVIARDDAPFRWTGSACALPFTFTGVPQLTGYGIKVEGLGGGTVWLTPSQAAQTVRLRIGPGFVLSKAG